MSTRHVLPLVLGALGLLPCLTIEDARDRDTTASPATTAETGTGTAPANQDKQVDPEAAKTCGLCHTDIYDEWNGRMHSKAWTDEIYQNKIKTKKRAKLCHACHIPDRVLERVGRKPKTRTKNLHEGVTCVACHEKDGAMHGPFGAETDAHKSVKDPLFTTENSFGLCTSCHSTKIDVVHPVGKDFKNAKMNTKGKSCTGCHMPEVERHMAISPATGKPVGPKRKGRSHRILGPKDPEFCATAFKLGAAMNGKNVELTIANEAGHGVPGLRIREFHFLVRQKDAAGKTLVENKIVINSENMLLVEEKRKFPFVFAAGAANLEVAIEHHFMDKLVAQVSLQTIKPTP